MDRNLSTSKQCRCTHLTVTRFSPFRFLPAFFLFSLFIFFFVFFLIRPCYWLSAAQYRSCRIDGYMIRFFVMRKEPSAIWQQFDMRLKQCANNNFQQKKFHHWNSIALNIKLEKKMLWIKFQILWVVFFTLLKFLHSF